MDLFTHHWVTSRIIRILDISRTACYLVLGNDRALLIDTGIGIGSLRAYVDALTSLPYDVLLTHGHVDHASGAQEYAGKRVYLHPADRTLMGYHTAFETRLDYVLKTRGIEADESKLIPQMDPAQTLPLHHGDRFDLGGLHVEAIHVPGHTHGMCMALIEEERFILFGDGCGVSVMLVDDEATTVDEYRKALANLKPHEQRYDHIIRNHGTCVSPKELLDNVIEVCDEVLAGTDDRFPVPAHTLPVEGDDLFFAKCLSADRRGRADGKEGNLAYRLSKIR